MLNVRIPQDLKNKIEEISCIRNVIIHNNGIVNERYIKRLEKNCIETKYKLGDDVLSDIYSRIQDDKDVLESVHPIIEEGFN